MSKIILSHPTGNANVRAAAAAMVKSQILHSFYTTIACFPHSLLNKISIGPLSEIRRRSYDSSLQDYTRTYSYKEFGRMVANRLALAVLTKHETGIFSVDSVYRYQDSIVAKKIRKAKSPYIKGVYAYEDGALESFRAAQETGILSFYELPIPYWRCFHKILEEEKNKLPEWAVTFTGLKDSEEKLQKKDAEIELADVIFVANSFTARSLSEFPNKLNAPIKVIPYGFPPVYKERAYERKPGDVLKLLFVGGLSQQKGLANLLEAVNSLGDKVSLTLVGRKSVENCAPLNDSLAKHRWIPSLSHKEVLEIMREHDIFVFPSLFEGFGMVITEAMSQGTPVITTERTAGIDLIKDGENGWLIKAGSTSSLLSKLEIILKEPSCISKVGRAAMDTALKRPWSVYEQELSMALQELIKHKTNG